SFLQVDFSLPSDAPYTLTGQYGKVGGFLIAFCRLTIQLNGPSGSVVNVALDNSPDGIHPLSFSGILPAGSYSLAADLLSQNIGASTQDVFAPLTLGIPEPSSAVVLLLAGFSVLRQPLVQQNASKALPATIAAVPPVNAAQLSEKQ